MAARVHEPYMAYAHWMLIHRMLTGAGVEQVHANMDIDSMSRAAFICAFADEIARGDAHGFYVRYTKFQTVDERKRNGAIATVERIERDGVRFRLEDGSVTSPLRSPPDLRPAARGVWRRCRRFRRP